MPSQIELRTKDGKKLCLQCYAPRASNGKVLVVAPTIGVTQDLYQNFASFFRHQGFIVITFDYRGMGRSGPQQLKGFEANVHQYAVQDVDAVILYVKNHYPNNEIIYAGHAVGGEILGLVQASQYISKVVLISSSLTCEALWPFKDRLRIKATKAVIRLLNRIHGYLPAGRIGVSANVPKGVMHEWANWCDHPNGLFDLFPDSNYRKLQVPLLAFTFTDDWRCPTKAVKALLGHYPNTLITWHHLKPEEVGIKKVGHTGFFDTGMQAFLWINLLHWMCDEPQKKEEN